MTVVTVRREDGIPLAAGREWTVDDLEDLPDDGNRYELFDGVLVVSPSPFPIHQRALQAMFLLLHEACPPELEVFVAPFDFQPTNTRSFQPDLLVVRRGDVGDWEKLTRPPVLTVEVSSDSTRSLDQVFKKSMYLTSGVDSYWIFDPRRKRFVAYEREGERYVQVADARGEERITVERPFPVEICPAEIVKG
jgi:Uma2 family endonuclease